jgi:hypothetical protein
MEHIGRAYSVKEALNKGTQSPPPPLLFVLIADLLHHIINKAYVQGLLQLPIQTFENIGFPIIQYTDDTIIFLKASQKELLCLRALLESFAQLTGLRVSYAKTGMVPINPTPKKAEIMAGVFGCRIQSMLFTYLGLPMGTIKLRVEHFAPLMNRAERQLTSISSMLTYADKLQLVNQVMSSLPTFTMCSVDVPVAVHEYFDRARCNCMWRNSDINAKNKPMVAWKNCTQPKRKGGLGIINLRSQNNALLLKHLDKFYNKKEVP